MPRPESKEKALQRAKELKNAFLDKAKGDWAFYPLFMAYKMDGLLRKLHTLTQNSDNPRLSTELKEIEKETKKLLRTYGYSFASFMKRKFSSDEE